jgi:hypothetical protein
LNGKSLRTFRLRSVLWSTDEMPFWKFEMHFRSYVLVVLNLLFFKFTLQFWAAWENAASPSLEEALQALLCIESPGRVLEPLVSWKVDPKSDSCACLRLPQVTATLLPRVRYFGTVLVFLETLTIFAGQWNRFQWQTTAATCCVMCRCRICGRYTVLLTCFEIWFFMSFLREWL